MPVLVTVLAAVEFQNVIWLFHSPGPNANVTGAVGTTVPRHVVEPSPIKSYSPDRTDVVSNWMSTIPPLPSR